MKQFILYTTALLCINSIAMESEEEQLRNFNNMPIIRQYREYAFAHMQPTTQIFLEEFPQDFKSKIIERYLFQISWAASIYKYLNQMRGLPESQDEIPQEVRFAYRMIPPSAFVYHRIVRNEIVEDENQLPYSPQFNPRQAWRAFLEELELRMATELENQS
jgi:hypothetical protein